MENLIILSINRIASKLKFPLRDFNAPIKLLAQQIENWEFDCEPAIINSNLMDFVELCKHFFTDSSCWIDLSVAGFYCAAGIRKLAIYATQLRFYESEPFCAHELWDLFDFLRHNGALIILQLLCWTNLK